MRIVFAAHFQSELILLHVVEPVYFDYAMVEPLGNSAGLNDAHRSAAKQSLDTLPAQICPGCRSVLSSPREMPQSSQSVARRPRM